MKANEENTTKLSTGITSENCDLQGLHEEEIGEEKKSMIDWDRFDNLVKSDTIDSVAFKTVASLRNFRNKNQFSFDINGRSTNFFAPNPLILVNSKKSTE